MQLTEDVVAAAAGLPPRPGAHEAGAAPVGHELPAGARRHQVLEPVLAEVGAVTLGQRRRLVREHVQALGVGVQAAAADAAGRGDGAAGAEAPVKRRSRIGRGDGGSWKSVAYLPPRRRRQEQLRRRGAHVV